MSDPLEAAHKNTDRELFREDTGEPAGSYYENSCFVTTDQELGINVGGTVYVKTLADWHSLAAIATQGDVTDGPWDSDPAVQCVLNMDRVDDWGVMNDAERAVDATRIAELSERLNAAVECYDELQTVAGGLHARIAELEAKILNDLHTDANEAEYQTDRAEAAEATVERVRALSDEWKQHQPHSLNLADLRAALADPKVVDLGVWTQEQVDSINERAARRDAALAPLIEDGEA
jgi:hypothetical protein